MVRLVIVHELSAFLVCVCPTYCERTRASLGTPSVMLHDFLTGSICDELSFATLSTFAVFMTMIVISISVRQEGCLRLPSVSSF